MSLPWFQSCVNGYEGWLKDQQAQAVMTGYWTAYYTNSKHPKKPEQIIKKISENQQKSHSKHVDSVDVEAYKAMEARFKSLRGDSNG